MDFLKSIGRAVGNAASFVGEKNRKAAYLNRIRTVIKCEEQAAEKQYLALGRYYYNNLRDRNNAVTEPHCAEIEAIEARLDAALAQLEKFYAEDAKDGVCPCDPAREEFDLDDVQCFDAPPVPEETAVQPVAKDEPVSQEGDTPPQETAAPKAPEAAPQGENDNLPFEG